MNSLLRYAAEALTRRYPQYLQIHVVNEQMGLRGEPQVDIGD